MRLPYLLLSFALLFTTGSCGDQLLVGKWSVGNTKTDLRSEFFCCVPLNLNIAKDTSSGNIKATFEYTSTGRNCDSLFGTWNSAPTGSMTLYNFSTYIKEKFVSEVSTRTELQLNFEIGYDNGRDRPNLNVYTTRSPNCNFTMSKRQDWPAPQPTPTPQPTPQPNPTPVPNENPNNSSSGSNTNSVFIVVIICLVIVIFALFMKNQSKQSTTIAAEKHAQQPNLPIHQQYNQPQTTYNAPNQFPNNQYGQYGQPQVNYIAPNLYPNNQMNVNYGARF